MSDVFTPLSSVPGTDITVIQENENEAIGILSSTGSGGIIPAADGLVAGVVTPGDYFLFSAKTRKFVATLNGDDVTTTFNVLHDLNTADVIVSVRESGSTNEFVLVDIVAAPTSIQVQFGTAPATGEAYRVVITG